MQLKLVILLAVGLMMSGCQSLPLEAFSRLIHDSHDTDQALLSADEIQQKITLNLENKEHLKALALIISAVHQGNPESLFEDTYPQAVNGVLSEAIQQRSIGNAQRAGILFKTVYLAYPHANSLQVKTSMSITEIDASIELCASQLLEEGLSAYRDGDLSMAISTWEKISRFHPQHAASQRAIETTRVQLTNLQQID